ncbi:MAG TPA: glycosyltransferase family 39 protein [Ignavibacteria bacterium]|nr:glycosyltransferase family 39 protein [Ignavibacteria bacterium]
MVTNLGHNTVIYSIAGLAFILRIVASYFMADLQTPEMWEFGMIARNLLNGEGFTFEALTKNVPSAFMPPGLPYIYYIVFYLIGDNSTGYFFILLLNSVLASTTVVLLYMLTSIYFNRTIAIITAFFTAISPVYIYSATSFNSIVIYQFLLILSLLLFSKLFNQSNTYAGGANRVSMKYTILLGFVSGIFLYFRAESLVFILFITFYLLKNKFVSRSVVYFFICVIMISPWTIRNYITFGKLIPVSTSFGYNFYTGHGDEASTEIYKQKLSLIEEDKNFEIMKSNIALETAFDYIKNNPVSEVKESVRKVFSLWVFDLYRQSSRNPVYLIMWLPVLFFFTIGTFRLFQNRKKYIILKPVYYYLVFSTLLVIVFFNIPRYQVQMSIVLVPIAVFGLLNLKHKMKDKIT